MQAHDWAEVGTVVTRIKHLEWIQNHSAKISNAAAFVKKVTEELAAAKGAPNSAIPDGALAVAGPDPH